MLFFIKPLNFNPMQNQNFEDLVNQVMNTVLEKHVQVSLSDQERENFYVATCNACKNHPDSLIDIQLESEFALKLIISMRTKTITF